MAYAVGEDRSNFQRGDQSWSEDAFGFAKATEDLDYTDPTFPANWYNLWHEGKVRGAYHFFHPASNPAAQARFFVDHVDANGGFEPEDIFMCDSEITSGAQGQEVLALPRQRRMHCPLRAHGPMGGAVGDLTLEFMEAVAALVGPANPVLLYSDRYMAVNDLAGCTSFPLFVADYAESPPSDVAPWPDWVFWQNADSGGQGGGDSDRFNGDEQELRAWVASYHRSPVPVVAATGWTEGIVAELPTLVQGDTGPFVGKMQSLLVFAGKRFGVEAAAGLTEDSDFGPATRAAVTAMQGYYRIAGGNSQCGERTWTHLLLS